MLKEKLFSDGSEPWVLTSDGNRRRVLLHLDQLMLVEFAFEKGATGSLHAHEHVQASYVAEGEFEITIDGHTQVVTAGNTFIVPSNCRHGVKALSVGRLIDSFTPRRTDFL